MRVADSEEADSRLEPAEFHCLMQAVGPFESRPRLAVAVSGGSDSMALTLLAADWARRCGGEITAITVDHGLRPEAAAEARQVGRWLRARGIAHRILRWRPPAGALAGGVQAAARAARYGLLADWCRRHGVLHLALAHQQEDQAETLLLRLARGSGLDGLAAMAPVAERAGIRLIRPLLPVTRARLRATLAVTAQPWIDDPSNDDPAHARIRMRRLLPTLAAEGLDTARLAATAMHLGRTRAAIEDGVADLLAAAALIHPAGYVRLDPAAMKVAPAELSLRALAHCLMAVGGSEYVPRLDRLERLHRKLRAGALAGGATLAGCLVVPRRGTLLICREPAMAVEEVVIAPGATVLWDGRFQITRPPAGPGRRAARLVVRRLGGEGWAALAARNPGLRGHAIPPAVRPSLPALWSAHGIVAVPHLDIPQTRTHMTITAAFLPAAPLVGARFAGALLAGSPPKGSSQI
jgi:tRNA(Ile)-lysidine synthase